MASTSLQTFYATAAVCAAVGELVVLVAFVSVARGEDGTLKTS